MSNNDASKKKLVPKINHSTIYNHYLPFWFPGKSKTEESGRKSQEFFKKISHLQDIYLPSQLIFPERQQSVHYNENRNPHKAKIVHRNTRWIPFEMHTPNFYIYTKRITLIIRHLFPKQKTGGENMRYVHVPKNKNETGLDTLCHIWIWQRRLRGSFSGFGFQRERERGTEENGRLNLDVMSDCARHSLGIL